MTRIKSNKKAREDQLPSAHWGSAVSYKRWALFSGSGPARDLAEKSFFLGVICLTSLSHLWQEYFKQIKFWSVEAYLKALEAATHSFIKQTFTIFLVPNFGLEKQVEEYTNEWKSWIFIGRTDAEAEALILWLPDVKSWLFGKFLDARKVEGKKRRGWQKMRWLDGITDSMDMS